MKDYCNWNFKNQAQQGQPWSSTGSGSTDVEMSSVTFFLALVFLEDDVDISCNLQHPDYHTKETKPSLAKSRCMHQYI